VRAAHPGFQRADDARLEQELARRRLPVLRLDARASDDWLDAVEREVRDRLRPSQLELL